MLAGMCSQKGMAQEQHAAVQAASLMASHNSLWQEEERHIRQMHDS